MTQRDWIIVGIVFWYLWRSKSAETSSVNILPNKRCYYPNGQSMDVLMTDPCPVMPEWGGGSIYQETTTSAMQNCPGGWTVPANQPCPPTG